MDDLVDDNREAIAPETLISGDAEAERAPNCPVCHRRLAILKSRTVRTEAGGLSRRQLWGCPRGHATAHRTDGVFGAIQILPDLD